MHAACDLVDSGWHVHGAGPQSDDRDQDVGGVEQRTPAVLGLKDGHKGASDTLGTGLPALRFADTVKNQSNQNRGRAADHEHRPPTKVFAYEVICNRREKEAEIVARVHVGRARLTAILGPLLCDEGATHRPFAANSDSGEQPEDRNLPYVLTESREEGEQGVAKNRERQRAYPAVSVGYRPPDERHTPTHEEKGEQQPAVKAYIRGSCCNARFGQQLAHRRHQNQRVDERVHSIQRPAGPRGPKAAHLIFRKRGLSGRGHVRWLKNEDCTKTARPTQEFPAPGSGLVCEPRSDAIVLLKGSDVRRDTAVCRPA